MQWYAVQVTTGHEKKVKKYLEKRKSSGFADPLGEISIPMAEGRPVVSGYIFVQSTVWPEFYLAYCTTTCKVIGAVTEEEITKLVDMDRGQYIPPPIFKKGDEVIICSGPLYGTKGIVKRSGKRKSKISFFDGEVVIDAENGQLVSAQEGA